jgi:hypothetical protein
VSFKERIINKNFCCSCARVEPIKTKKRRRKTKMKLDENERMIKLEHDIRLNTNTSKTEHGKQQLQGGKSNLKANGVWETANKAPQNSQSGKKESCEI